MSATEERYNKLAKRKPPRVIEFLYKVIKLVNQWLKTQMTPLSHTCLKDKWDARLF